MKLKELGFTTEIVPEHFSVKAPVFPFVKFPGLDTLLGPEMKSTGEVMGIDENFGAAFAKAMQAAGVDLPAGGQGLPLGQGRRQAQHRCARQLASPRWASSSSRPRAPTRPCSTRASRSHRVNKIHEGRPHVVDMIKNHDIALVVNTPSGKLERSDDRLIRSNAVSYKVPCITNMAAAAAAVQAIATMRRGPLDVENLQARYA